MSLINPEVGERCRCLQCGHEGPIGVDHRVQAGAAPWFMIAVDGAVICFRCISRVTYEEHFVYDDVERIPKEPT